MAIRKKTVGELVAALAKVNAAFPAGEYHLNEKQNLAMNALNDVIFKARQEDKLFDAVCRREHRVYTLWILSRLILNGTITHEEAQEELKILAKLERKKQYGHTKKTKKEKPRK